MELITDTEMDKDRDGDVDCSECETPMNFLGHKILVKYGYTEYWECPKCGEKARFREDGELI